MYVVKFTNKWQLGRGVNIEIVAHVDKTILKTSVTVQLNLLNRRKTFGQDIGDVASVELELSCPFYQVHTRQIRTGK